MKIWPKIQLDSIIAIALGVMATFAFAPYNLFPLAILAPAGLLALIYRANPTQSFWLGFQFGLGLFGAGVYWVYISIHRFGDVPMLGATAITAAMVCILAIYPGLTCYFANRYLPNRKPTQFNYAFAAIWVIVDFFRGLLLSGFPWLFFGYSQTNSPLSGYAPIFGVYGTTYAILILSSLLVYAANNYRAKIYRNVYSAAVAFTLIWVVGAALIHIPWTHKTKHTASVSLVQGDIPQSLKWDPDEIKLSFDRYQKMTQPLLKKDRIIIWPEAAIPMPLQNAADYINTMDSKARQAGAHVLLGIPMYKEDGEGYYNALVSLGQDRNIYLKRLLVPFGEYIPLKRYLANALNIIAVPMPNTLAGRANQAPFDIGSVRILPSICYEIAFPDVMRSMDKTIGVLLTVTNDAWFGHSNAQAQHLQMAAMRAIEMQRPLLFVSNDGITAVIGPHGNILSAAPPRTPYVLNADIQPTYGLTPWMRNGSNPILALLILLLISSWLTSRKFATEEPDGITATSQS